jgi:hypothetical protein
MAHNFRVHAQSTQHLLCLLQRGSTFTQGTQGCLRREAPSEEVLRANLALLKILSLQVWLERIAACQSSESVAGLPRTT